ncbi:FtsX-like permease family protein [Clostridium estertheticum]|uniref:FtsX-like permease family protein n=1 Tax=Clostridium estertheticum TaxID=238834 RepID=UPI001C0BDCC6|nr:ABC transporter permease [Clostridium estertheticum]MBU3073610.1 ABC transporter permease [Clostridium estertheticum]MBU3163703.1 ABC transporter permease [Clostridium estertheticum]
MTLNAIVRKLFKNNIKQYALFISSIIFAVTMIGGYGLLQFSPTVTKVLIDGGSTQQITLSMFAFTLIGTFIFVIYAYSSFIRYKSREIGVFISLGIRRNNVCKIVIKELNIIFLTATLLGLLFSILISWLSWTVLTLFLKTEETAFSIGWTGMAIAILFSALCMIITRVLTSRYIKKIDVIKILKAEEQVEDNKGDSFVLGLIGIVMIPAGVILFTSSTKLYFLIASLIGLYLLIIQITSIGVLFKKISPSYYYKNIVFFNLIKSKGKQYTLPLFVSTILIGVGIFGVAFSSVPMISGILSTIYVDPYDYMVKVGFQQGDFNESDIKKLAIDNNVKIKDFKEVDTIILGEYSKKYNEWGSINFVSEETVYNLTGKKFDINPGSYINIISADENSDSSKYHSQPIGPITLLNPTTKKEFTLNNRGIKFIDKIMNPDTAFERKGFCVIDTVLFNKLRSETKKEYIFKTYIFNTPNWRETGVFSNALFNSIIKSSGGEWCPNYSTGVIFDRIRKQAPNEPVNYEYKEYKENSSKANRNWGFTPYSRYHIFNSGISDFAVYLLLTLYISIIAIVSAIMTIGLKILNTMWQDKSVYKNITFLGVGKTKIKSIISKQIALIYFVPVTLGTIITLFLFKSIMTHNDWAFLNVSFLFACGLSLLVVLIQVGLFFVIRKQAIKECVKFIDV